MLEYAMNKTSDELLSAIDEREFLQVQDALVAQGIEAISLSYMEGMAHRLAVIYQRMQEAYDRRLEQLTEGNHALLPKLCAVSKTVDLPELLAAYFLGCDCFGENRPQELIRKAEHLSQLPLARPVELHQIGRLQSNKINMLLGTTVLIHSVDSFDLAYALNKRAKRDGLVQEVLLQINVSKEKSKAGMSAQELEQYKEELRDLDNLKFCGLMTMAPALGVSHNEDLARQCFSQLNALQEQYAPFFSKYAHPFNQLSMGMSEDFEEAIAEGATLIRLGRIVFQD